MKRIIKASCVLIILFVFLAFKGEKAKNIKPADPSRPISGVAVIMTGAAARIPQEAALLEELDRRGELNNLVFISGVSSGALNAVALNGIMSHKLTWDEYKNILFSLKDSNIFIREGRKLPANTEPERQLFTNIFENLLGYRTIGDLPFATSISVTSLRELNRKERVFRLCSRNINEECDTTLSLVDIMMATTAFPVAFPPARIRNVKMIPNVAYSDGGTGVDHVPYKALLEFEKKRGYGVEKVYIISRKSDSIPEVSEELRALGINDNGVFDRIGVSMDDILKKGIIRCLKDYGKDAPELAPLTYVWIPDFEGDFPMFNFNTLKVQFEMTSQWARTHNPVPYNSFMKPYLFKEKLKQLKEKNDPKLPLPQTEYWGSPFKE